MVDPRPPNLSIDSGQLSKLNALSNTKSVVTNLEPLESAQKQTRNPCLTNNMEIDEFNDGLCEDNVTTDEMIETEQVEKWKGLNLKMRHSRKEEYDEDDYVSEVIDKLVILLKRWMTKGVIGGVHDHEQKIVHEIENDVSSWLIEPKIVYSTKAVEVEVVLQLNTDVSIHQLHMHEKEYCNQYSM